MVRQNEKATTQLVATPATSTNVWFVTVASCGLGRVWAEAALKRGDKLAATARQVESIAYLNETYGENVSHWS